MNILFRMEKGIAVCLFSSFFVLACVNHIPGEKAAVSNGDIPLKFTADIHEATYTRVAGNGFEENDEVGVFALVGSSTMKEERYADNLRFFRTSEKVFESSEPIYYPDDEVTLRLIGSSSNLVVISFLFHRSSSFLILLKVVDMFAF